MPPVPIEGGVGLFLYEYSLADFSRQQFILPAQDLDFVQIWLVSCLLVMFCHCWAIDGNFCSVFFNVFSNWSLGSPSSTYKHQELGPRQRWVPEVDQSVRIQLPSAEDGEGFLWNIRFKNVSVVEQF